MTLTKCPKCGSEIDESYSYCSNCGLKMKKSNFVKILLISLSVIILIIIVVPFLIGLNMRYKRNQSGNSVNYSEIIQNDFKQISFSEGFSNKLSNIPMFFQIPKDYITHYISADYDFGVNVWCTKNDLNTILNNSKKYEVDYSKVKNGLFLAKISLNVGYNQTNNKFTGEDNLSNQLKQYGLESKVQKIKYNQYPALIIEGKVTKNTTKGFKNIYMMYIAIPSKNITLSINYIPIKSNLSLSDKVWKIFVENIKVDLTNIKQKNTINNNNINNDKMMLDSIKYEKKVNKYLSVLKKGNVEEVFHLFSKNGVNELGKENTKKWLKDEVLPYLQKFKKIKSDSLVTRAKDLYGNTGYSFHFIGILPNGTQNKFKIQIIKESGNYVIGNIVTVPN